MPVHARPLSRATPTLLLGAILSAALAPPVAAQQPKWRPLDAGLNWDVDVAISYQGHLIVGGGFTHAGETPLQGVARWDGNNWHSIDDGFVDQVTAMHVHDGILYAGGTYFTGDPNDPTEHGVFAWDGDTWTLLNGGTDFNGVHALTTLNGDLIVACWRQGSLTSYDRDYIVMRWDGAHWNPLGDGEFWDGQVNALAVYNGELIAAGSFDRWKLYDINGIARWDGTTWQRLGNGLVASGIGESFRDVRDLEVYEGKLIAAGSFSAAGGRMVRNIARWNGAEWRGLDGGADQSVFGLTVYQNDLIAIGQFQRIGGVQASRIARWDPQQGWRPLGKGFNDQGPALCVWREGLIAGGEFTRSGPRELNHIALWPRE